MRPEHYPPHLKAKDLILARFQKIRKLRVLLLKVEKMWDILWIDDSRLDKFYQAVTDLDHEEAFALHEKLQSLWLSRRYHL